MKYQELFESKNYNPGGYGVRASILLLRECFKNNPEFEYKIYEDDLSKADAFRSLLITTKNDWETTYKSKRPAIIVSHGNVILGSQLTQGNSRVERIEENGAVTFFTDLTSFPIVIECLSESDVEASVLSSIVGLFLTSDLRVLRSVGFQIQGIPTQTPAQPYEKGNISFISSVIIQVQLQRKYRARIMNEKMLENVNLKLNGSTNVIIDKE